MNRCVCSGLSNDTPELLIILKDAKLGDNRHNDFVAKGTLAWESKIDILPPCQQFLMPCLTHIQFVEDLECVIGILKQRVNIQQRILLARLPVLDFLLIQRIEEQTNGLEEV